MTLPGAVAQGSIALFQRHFRHDWINDNATPGWSSVSGGPYTSPWSDGANAYFQGTANTVNVSGLVQSVGTRSTLMSTAIPWPAARSILPATGAIATGPAGDAISSVLTGSVGLTKSGGGVLTLGAANSYSGPTVINGGTLKMETEGCRATSTPSAPRSTATRTTSTRHAEFGLGHQQPKRLQPGH